MDNKVEKRKSFIINIIYFSIIAAIAYIVLVYGTPLILPFIIAFALVAIFNPLVKKLDAKLKIKKEILSFALILLVYVAIGVLLSLLIMQLISWGSDLAGWLPDYIETTIKPILDNTWLKIQELLGHLPDRIVKEMDNMWKSLMSGDSDLLKPIPTWGKDKFTSATNSVPKYIIGFIFTIMLSIFVSIRYDEIVGFFRAQLTPKGERIWKDFQSIVKNSIGQYIKALMILMIITFGILTIGLLILRVPFAPLAAAGIALLDVLPVFGTGTVLLPWAVVAFFQGDFKLALGLVILYGAIALVRNLIEPHVVGDKLGLNPVVSLVTIYIGYRLFGVFGMIFMPIITQTLLEFHRMGTIKLFKDPVTEQAPSSAEPTTEERLTAKADKTSESPKNKKDTSKKGKPKK